MSVSERISSLRCHLAIVMITALAVGCAASPQPQPAYTSIAESPGSASKLVDTADFLKKAQDDGWAPEVRNGEVIYCRDETPLNSRLPERDCLNKTGVEQMMLAEQKQRDSMRSHPAPGCSPNGCN